MTLAVFNSATFITTSGLAVGASATIEVRRESDNGLAAIYSDAAGVTPITNPSAFADTSGRFKFYAAGLEGGYSILVTKGAESYTLHNVAIGTAAQIDLTAADLALKANLAGPTFTGVVAGPTPALGDNSTTFATTAFAMAAMQGYISGLIQSNGPVDTTNDIQISAGLAIDGGNAVGMYLPSAIIKQLDAAWAVGTNAGGLDTGAIANADYYIWLIKRTDTGVVDVLFSLSSTAPTMPTNYTLKRLIGWFKRVGATIVAFTVRETEGGGMELLWTAPTLDINLSNTLTTARRTDAVKVPLNFSVTARLHIVLYDAGSPGDAQVYCPDHSDGGAPSGSAAPLANFDWTVAKSAIQQIDLRTSATGTIAARSTVATTDVYEVSTMSFKWARRL